MPCSFFNKLEFFWRRNVAYINRMVIAKKGLYLFDCEIFFLSFFQILSL